MNKFIYWLVKIFIDPLIKKIFIKEIKGLENIPKGNFIFVSNHQSYLDILIDGCICSPRSFHFLGQIDGWHGISKFFMKGIYFIMGTIPFSRKIKKSRKEATKKAINFLKKGNIVVIYPEGARSRTGKIGEGKLGVAKIFLKTEVPILPLAKSGSFDLFPPGGKLKIEKKVKINIGPPLYFKEEIEESKNIKEGSEEYKKILIKITDKMMARIAELKEEIL